MSADQSNIPPVSEPDAPPAAAVSVAELQARSGLYQLLGRCLEAEVDATLLATLRGPLSVALAEIGVDLGADVRQGVPAVVLAALAEEFAGLFVVPGAVMPFRSAFETGRMFQPQSDLASAAYTEAGFAFHAHLSGEFPDHIAVMLAFVSQTLAHEAAALTAGDHAAATLWQQRRVRFLLRQIGPWAIGWCRRAGGATRHPFYRAILGLTEQVIWSDICEVADQATLKRLVTANRRPLMRQKTDPDFRKASGL